MAIQSTYLVIACRSGELLRVEHNTVPAAYEEARTLRAKGFAVHVMRPGSWAR